jgi:hypothetical protein
MTMAYDFWQHRDPHSLKDVIYSLIYLLASLFFVIPAPWLIVRYGQRHTRKMWQRWQERLAYWEQHQTDGQVASRPHSGDVPNV